MSQRHRSILDLLQRSLRKHEQSFAASEVLAARLSTSSLSNAPEGSSFWGGLGSSGSQRAPADPETRLPYGSGVKTDLLQLLGTLPQATSTDALWELAKENPKLKSKRFMKQMLQQLKKSGMARTEPLDSRHFGYRLSGRAVRKQAALGDKETVASVPEESVQEPPPRSFWS